MSTSPNYTLEIISHHPQFKNKSLRQYYVDGINTVGAWGDEPFEIRFKNNTWQKVQVKLSLDGTDILNGEVADTEVSKDMWVVNGYDTLSLKAWPETNNGGASFIFTSANNSVAVHTHGDLSSRGIIAAAVFTEGHVEPIRVNNHYHYDYYRSYPYYISGGGTFSGSAGSIGGLGGGLAYGAGQNSVYTSNVISNQSTTADSISFNSSLGETSISCNVGEVEPCAASFSASDSRSKKSLESLVSVGAGQHVDQKITYVTGLTKPVFTETVRVRYLWWDDLTAKLRTESKATAHASGFPGDKKQKNIDLGSTPRKGEKQGSFRRAEVQEPVFARV